MSRRNSADDPSDKRPAEGLSAAPVPWLTALGLAFAFWFALLLDPFGIDSASSARSEQVAMRITSAFYTGSGEVTVVLIDDAYLERTRSSWPMPYAQQGLLLHRLLQYQPKSVFLDILYRRPHRGLAATPQANDAGADVPGDLPAALAQDTDDTPIYLPVLIDPAWAHRSDIELCPRDYETQGRPTFEGERDLAELFQPAGGVANLFGEHRKTQVVQLGWFGCGNRYPLYLASNRQARTPAFAMYEDTLPGGVDARKFLAPLLVRWGSHPPSAQIPFYRHGVCQRAAVADEKGKDRVPLSRKIKVAAQEILLGVLSDLREERDPEVKRPCLAVNVISAGSLIGDRDVNLERVLAGKHVLVGVKIEGVTDSDYSPVHEQVPGVMVHAMALDNLLNHGAYYAKDIASTLKWLMSALVLIALVLASRWLYRRKSSPAVTRVLSWAGLAMWLLIAVIASAYGLKGWPIACLIVGLAVDSMHPRDTAMHGLLIVLLAILAPICLEFGVAPLNWIGLFLVAFAFLAAVKPLYKAEVRRFPHPESLLGRLNERLKSSPPPVT